jgi:hypothetical protein
MPVIEASPLPSASLLAVHHGRGAYTDCYTTAVPGSVALEDYVVAFYTSGLFRIERWLLGRLAGRKSTDAEARQLAAGTGSRFAAWDVEARDARQLLLRDFTGRTRSWLMVERESADTRLYFGSAVLPKRDPRSGAATLGWPVHALLGFHRLYSVALLRAAVRAPGMLRGS